MMNKRLAACAVAFAASAVVGLGAPAAVQAQTPSTDSGEYVAQAYYYSGAYSTLSACEAAGSDFSDETHLPWYCEKGNNDGRTVYKLYLWVG